MDTSRPQTCKYEVIKNHNAIYPNPIVPRLSIRNNGTQQNNSLGHRH